MLSFWISRLLLMMQVGQLKPLLPKVATQVMQRHRCSLSLSAPFATSQLQSRLQLANIFPLEICGLNLGTGIMGSGRHSHRHSTSHMEFTKLF